MAEPAFDTLMIARELERDYGYEQKQAEGVSTIIYRHLVGNVATKDDLKHAKEELTEKIEAVEGRLTDKIEGVDERLTEKIEGVEGRLTEKIEGVEGRLTDKIEGVDERLTEKIEGVEGRLTEKIASNGKDRRCRRASDG